MSRWYRRWVKRSLDLVFGVILLILLSPVLLVLAVVVQVKLGSPVLFRQQRPGRDGRPFTLVKFRTMRDATDAAGRPLPDSERMTAFGSWLRRVSLDELPELLNVVSGSMSFVGPRPLLMEYLPRYSDEQARRHEVRPGLTGLAQVSGRNGLTWPDRFAIDVWYVDNVSFRLDASILWRTVATVLGGRGVAAEGDVTMPPFQGD